MRVCRVRQRGMRASVDLRILIPLSKNGIYTDLNQIIKGMDRRTI